MKIKIYSLYPKGGSGRLRADAENAAKLLLQRIIFFACMPTNYYLILFFRTTKKHAEWFPPIQRK
jgi:hypothetical protein